MGLSETMASSICIGPTELASAVSGTLKVAESPLASTFASSLCTSAVVVDEDQIGTTPLEIGDRP